ncbi:unnamed protein product [Brassica napus]|uniref:(rape) hypothetical protein n=1 Tax=Brassica napus TaxID=3708 RepID=A0A816QPB4_BRANA|nr:unnamed protein product [Brassica napus]
MNFLKPYLYLLRFQMRVHIVVMIQKLKEAEITEQDSLLLTRNLLRIAIFNISYIRGLFPENYFNDKSVPALDMKIKKLLPIDAESRRLVDWMEKVDGPMIEEYSFSFSYSDSDSQDVSMNISLTGTKKHGGVQLAKYTSSVDEDSRQNARQSMNIFTLLLLLLRTIVMKLMYYDDVTPQDYEPPFFRGCTEEEAQHVWPKDPLRMEVGNVNSKHLVLTLKVKSVLDPCEDENDGMQDGGKSIGPDSVHDDQLSDSDSEISQTRETQFLVAPVEKQEDDNGEVDEDDTHDSIETQQQLARVKDWINSRHLDTLELTDVLSNFPEISIVISFSTLEKIMDQLEKEGALSKTRKDTYVVNRDETPWSEFNFVKDESDALYHSLPMQYVTTTKLHNMLDGEASQTAVRKLIYRMIQEGYLEDSNNRRLGKRVVHSSLTERKLNEVRKVLDLNDDMDVDADEAVNKTNATLTAAEVSTRAGIHSIGSDLTHTKERYVVQQNGPVPSEQTISKANDTPVSINAQVRDPILQQSKRQKAQAN